MSIKKVIQITWVTAQYIIYLLPYSFLSTEEEQREVSFGIKLAKLVCVHSFTTLIRRQAILMQKVTIRLSIIVFFVHDREKEQ